MRSNDKLILCAYVPTYVPFIAINLVVCWPMCSQVVFQGCFVLAVEGIVAQNCYAERRKKRDHWASISMFSFIISCVFVLSLEIERERSHLRLLYLLQTTPKVRRSLREEAVHLLLGSPHISQFANCELRFVQISQFFESRLHSLYTSQIRYFWVSAHIPGICEL